MTRAPSGSIRYADNRLMIEAVDLEALATEVGTPFYCYSSQAIADAYNDLYRVLSPLSVGICYAVKANGNISVLRQLASLGAGADIVSAGELRRALCAGIAADTIVFSGVGKTAGEIAVAICAGVRQINVESTSELDLITRVARELGRVAPVVLRVNPDVDARTHAKITTGTKHSKFGIDIDCIEGIYAAAVGRPELAVVGLAVHIGSQLMDLDPYAVAYRKLAALTRSLRAAGHSVRRLDLGGGLGVSYDQTTPPDLDRFAHIVAETVGALGCELTVEPGRFLIARAGVLVTRVIHVKGAGEIDFAIVDAAMNDLMRPALYDAHHEIVPVVARTNSARHYDVVGPVCESTDVFGQRRSLPELMTGDLLAIRDTGAYGAVLSSTYNGRSLVPEVLVTGKNHAVVRRRVEIDEQLAIETVAPWLLEEPLLTSSASR